MSFGNGRGFDYIFLNIKQLPLLLSATEATSSFTKGRGVLSRPEFC